MKERMEFDPSRDEGAGEPKDQEDMRRLDGITEEPEAAVEQGGDYREAEAIRGALESVVETGGEIPGATPLPIPRPEDAVEPGKPPEDAAEVQLDGKGAGQSPDIAGEVSLATPQETQSSGAPDEGGSSEQAIDADDSLSEQYLKQMSKIRKDNQTFSTPSEIKKDKHPNAKDSIANIR